MIDPKLGLIDKRDSFEIILDQLCGILLVESARQFELAQAAGKDPKLWDMLVYQERSNPFEEFLHATGASTPAPIVNVWYDTSSYQKAGSDVVRKQRAESTYNIDVIGGGVAHDQQHGHAPGDKAAVQAVHRTLRLCRNIVMAAEYTYLALPRTFVAGRWPDSLQKFQPTTGDNRPIMNVVGARLTLTVTHNEYAPQIEGDDLDLISVTVEDDGEVKLVDVDYDKTG